MISKIQNCHTTQPAYVYIRQSTMNQVLHHQESTERQYALKDKARELGWTEPLIRVLDADLGVSGTQIVGREDFKILVADVSMGKVGAVFALEASRLARSCADWHRLLELCSLSGTLIIDEDGCYDPSDFNDQLLLGLKGTMSQAELHFIRARLQGGKLNKAKKGQLKHPLPVGMSYDDQDGIVLDSNEEVRGAVQLVFTAFRQSGSAYGVVHRFTEQGLGFPKRAYDGVWNGQLIWGPLRHSRVLGILKNPTYAGAYVYGRYKYKREIAPDGSIRSKCTKVPMPLWPVVLQDHHERYISWQEYLDNQTVLQKNRTNGEENLLSGPAREGLALCQGLLLCGECGRRLSVHYKGNGGIYPVYQCNYLRREGLAKKPELCIRCDLIDQAVCRRLFEVLQPAEVDIALKAIHELEQRNKAVHHQWQMRIQRAEYEAQLTQRRYEEVDPANRLVASTLESRWNQTLVALEQAKEQYAQYQQTEIQAISKEQEETILALIQDLPRLWNAPTTQAKDRKRILRLLVKDITVEKLSDPKQIVLHLRWQGGTCEDIRVSLPLRISDRLRYPKETVDRIRDLARTLSADQIAQKLNEEGFRSPKGKPFTAAKIRWIRYKYAIPAAPLKQPGEITVKEAAGRFGVSLGVVYYWIERGIVAVRRINPGSPYCIKTDAGKEKELFEWVANSSHIRVRAVQHSQSRS
jgi:DNA invertase Pin-like site-specific DNA recombinase